MKCKHEVTNNGKCHTCGQQVETRKVTRAGEVTRFKLKTRLKPVTELTPPTLKTYKADLRRYRRLLVAGDPRQEWLRQAVAKLEKQLGKLAD